MHRSLLAITLASALASACGGDGDGDGSPEPPVETVTVTPNPASVQVGATVQLAATLEDANGNALTGRTVTWASGAAGTATVTGSGVVGGVAPGTVTITATSEGKSGSATVTVTAPATDEPIPPGSSAAVFTAFDKQTGLSRLYYGLAVAYAWHPLVDVDLPPATGGGVPLSSSGGGNLTLGTGLARAAEVTSSVLFTGGYADATNIESTTRAVLYDAEANEGVELEMTAARIYHTNTPLSGNRVLVTGGFNGNVAVETAEIFTEATRSFSATGSMGVARGRHAAAPLPDGRVLITGGLVPAGVGPATIDDKTAEVFDPATGTFTPTGDMSVTRFNHSAIALNDGRVLVLGGNGRKSAEVYDPSVGTFAPAGDMEVAHGLGHAAVKLLDGRVLVVGGDAGSIQPSAVVEIFDPATNEFTRVADMSTERMLHFALLIETDGSVLVGGGLNDAGDLLASAERYVPASNTWEPVPDMPVATAEQVAAFVTR
jgi:Big-like domain-containing protein/Kelch motif protein/galactose oxidase-like protein